MPKTISYELYELQEGSGEEAEPYALDSKYKAVENIRELPVEGFYNAAAWVEEDGITHLLGRQVLEAGGTGEPDVGSLMLLTLGPDGNIESSKEVWQPVSKEYSLEDARVLPLSNGRIAIGLTSVAQEGEDYIPHPAVLITSTEELKKGNLQAPTVIKSMGRGDQTTPIGENDCNLAGKNVTSIDQNLFAFRPDTSYHQLQVFKYQKDGQAIHQQYIDLPENIPWAEFRVGTTMPPIWLNKHEAIFLIHGIKIVDGRYEYSIGSSRLLRDKNGHLSVDCISPEPIMHPDLFDGAFGSDVAELHSERRVVYLCGAVPIYDNTGRLQFINAYPNVGDKRTVEVTLSVDKLTKDWRRDRLTRLGALAVA